VLHLMPLVLRLANILMAYATGPCAGTAQQPEHYSSLSPAALRTAVLRSVDRREPDTWPEVRQSLGCACLSMDLLP
jgi:hypothetical protein